MTTDYDTLEALLTRPDEPTLAQLEDTLTTGYAQALQLEGERMRIERSLRAALRSDEELPSPAELDRLRRRLGEADGELRRLRDLLRSLRRHVYDPRVARGF